MNDKLPDYIIEQYGTTRAFKQEKRRHVENMRRALGNLRNACAFMPRGSAPIGQLAEIVETMQDACSVKNWGR